MLSLLSKEAHVPLGWAKDQGSGRLTRLHPGERSRIKAGLLESCPRVPESSQAWYRWHCGILNSTRCPSSPTCYNTKHLWVPLKASPSCNADPPPGSPRAQWQWLLPFHLDQAAVDWEPCSGHQGTHRGTTLCLCLANSILVFPGHPSLLCVFSLSSLGKLESLVTPIRF